MRDRRDGFVAVAVLMLMVVFYLMAAVCFSSLTRLHRENARVAREMQARSAAGSASGAGEAASP